MGAQVLLHEQTFPAKVLKVGLRIFNSSRRVDEIVRDLLDFSSSHLDAGIPIDPCTLDLAQTCADIVEEARTFHPDCQIELVLEGDLVGTWDGPRASQAFTHLISNAIQHGKPDAAIHVTLRGAAEGVLFECTMKLM